MQSALGPNPDGEELYAESANIGDGPVTWIGGLGNAVC